MSFFANITLARNTFFYLVALFLRPFRTSSGGNESSITPFPLAPDLENCITDNSSSDGIAGHPRKMVDLEMGICTVPSSYQHTPQVVSKMETFPKVMATPASAAITPKKPSGRPPLSIVTNLACIPASNSKHLASKSQSENISPVAPRKPTPLRRMPRYLNLTGSSPTTAASPVQKTPGDSKRRRGSLVWFAETLSNRAASSPITPTRANFCVSPPISPIKLESSRVNDLSFDLEARIHSVFYKNVDEEQEDEDARDFFCRDSVCSGAGLDELVFLVKDLDKLQPVPVDDDNEADDEEEDDYGETISILSTSDSPSSAHPEDIVVQIVSPSESSELPYLRNELSPKVSLLSLASSTSSAVFNDLLASVDRKYAGLDWANMVQIGDDEDDEDNDEFAGMNPYGGIAEDDDEEGGHWSDVLLLSDYED
ncbi:hypothetical protein C8J57DRAFT_1642800 [Mycena rebaudengoi]|nr:hypothetical protein C8J57DRAFT_1642800 [Mycena rebaudengoi]